MRHNDLMKPNLACKIGLDRLRGLPATQELNLFDYNPDKKVDKE